MGLFNKLNFKIRKAKNNDTRSLLKNSASNETKFKLTIQGASGKNMEIDNPQERNIDFAFKILQFGVEAFIILDSITPIDTFTFIQARGFEDGKCYVEAQYQDSDGLHNYGKDGVTETGLRSILEDFLAGRAPDISGWDHVVDC